MKIVIIDYKMGNLFSVEKAFSRIGYVTITSNKAKDIFTADKLILPGVGNFKQGIENIEKLGLKSALKKMVIDKNVPILGICLGMQMFTDYSEEGDKNGLGWIKAKTRRFAENDKLRIPTWAGIP